jgi:hypothetical protein
MVIQIKTGKVTQSDIQYYKNGYSTTTLISNAVPYHVLHTSSNVPPRQKYLGRGRLLVDVPASNAPPPLPPRTIWNDVYVQSLLGAKRGENHWVPNLANMADGVTAPIVNPESASRYYGQYEVESCDATDTHQKTTDNGIFFELLA